MQIFPEKYRLLGGLGVVLAAGFLTISVAGYIVSRDSIRQGISEQALPLTGDNIYSEIQKDLLRPVFISSLMAQDTFVRDWILNGEHGTEQITHYLKEVRQKYGVVSSFLVPERSRQYYHANGTLKSMQQSDPQDEWFFRVRTMKVPYETHVAPDIANGNAMTVFINYRVLDSSGNFIGAAGVGLTLDAMTRLIDSYQSRFQRNIYFADARGDVVLAGRSMKPERSSIRERPGIRDITSKILNRSSTPLQLGYRQDEANVLVNSRFIPELGWYLVVEQNVSRDVAGVERIFVLNLAISAAVTLLVLAISLFAVNRYQQRLERMAATDSLTGLMNRQAFEVVLSQSMRDVERTGRPLSAILFDVDMFKQVNDTCGHLAGDQVLHAIAQLARGAVRENDIITRWGGEEFLILLRDCNLEIAARLAEKMRKAIAGHDFSLVPPKTITASVGVAQYGPQESELSFFARADRARYEAKMAGRNRTILSITEEQD